MKIVKILGIALGVVAVGVSALLAYVSYSLPDVGPPPDIHIEATAERIEHGKYLASSVMGCLDCHSRRDFTKFAGPIKASTIGGGGELFGPDMGLPGNFYSPNITPFKLKDWTDGEIFRAITAGVSRDGRALFPIMPWPHYAKMDKEDVYSVIAYIRTIEPRDNEPPASEPAFPMNFIMNTFPQPATHGSKPSKSDILKYGEYMTNAAACMDCHTMQVKGEYQMDKYMAGGFEFKMPLGGTVRTANLTPDKETGIGSWTADQFVARFKVFTDSAYVYPDVAQGEYNTMMPWGYYAKMDEEDLRAIFAYLQTVPAVKHQVIKFTPE